MKIYATLTSCTCQVSDRRHSAEEIDKKNQSGQKTSLFEKEKKGYLKKFWETAKGEWDVVKWIF